MRPLFFDQPTYRLMFGLACAIWYVPELIGTFFPPTLDAHRSLRPYRDRLPIAQVCGPAISNAMPEGAQGTHIRDGVVVVAAGLIAGVPDDSE